MFVPLKPFLWLWQGLYDPQYWKYLFSWSFKKTDDDLWLGECRKQHAADQSKKRKRKSTHAHTWNFHQYYWWDGKSFTLMQIKENGYRMYLVRGLERYNRVITVLENVSWVARSTIYQISRGKRGLSKIQEDAGEREKKWWGFLHSCNCENEAFWDILSD